MHSASDGGGEPSTLVHVVHVCVCLSCVRPLRFGPPQTMRVLLVMVCATHALASEYEEGEYVPEYGMSPAVEARAGLAAGEVVAIVLGALGALVLAGLGALCRCVRDRRARRTLLVEEGQAQALEMAPSAKGKGSAGGV